MRSKKNGPLRGSFSGHSALFGYRDCMVCIACAAVMFHQFREAERAISRQRSGAHRLAPRLTRLRNRHQGGDGRFLPKKHGKDRSRGPQRSKRRTHIEERTTKVMRRASGSSRPPYALAALEVLAVRASACAAAPASREAHSSTRREGATCWRDAYRMHREGSATSLQSETGGR